MKTPRRYKMKGSKYRRTGPKSPYRPYVRREKTETFKRILETPIVFFLFGIVVICRLVAFLPFELLCKVLQLEDDEQLTLGQKIVKFLK